MFPGLAPTGENPNAGGKGMLRKGNGAIEFVSAVERTYTVAAPAEEVHAFYLGKLGGKVEHDSSDSFENVKPGGSTPVLRHLRAHNFEPDLGPDGRDMPGTKKRALFEKSRKPMANGEWVAESQFQWIIRDAKGDLRAFQVDVVDAGLARDWSSYQPKTTVIISVRQYKQ